MTVQYSALETCENMELRSGPLSMISGRQIYLPAPILGMTSHNKNFRFGIWTVWLHENHGFLACNSRNNGLVLAPSQPELYGSGDLGIIVYDRQRDAECLMNDWGCSKSPCADFDVIFAERCECLRQRFADRLTVFEYVAFFQQCRPIALVQAE